MEHSKESPKLAFLETPESLLQLSGSEIETILHRVLPLLEAEPCFLTISGSVAFVGETHGDFMTTAAILRRFIDVDRLVFLGDFIDREPQSGGSLENILSLLLAKLQYPEKIILLKGNHEANAIIPCFPCQFEHDLLQRFGSPRLPDVFREVFAALPLMVLGHRIFGAHGGFLADADVRVLQAAQKNDREILEDILWNDPVMSMTSRGVGRLFTKDELLGFLDRIGATVFLRGHDYQRLGESIYDDRCLTLFSARQYQMMGNTGVLVAGTSRDVAHASDLQVQDLSSGEWKPYLIHVVED